MRKQAAKKSIKYYGIKIFALGFWLLLWETFSRWFGDDILLAAPSAVLLTLAKLIVIMDFWQTILFSSLRIIIGFLLALLIGILLAIGSYNSRLVKELLSPLMKTIQSMPVASFIILALIWIKAKNLSVLASFLMAMPLIYSDVSAGLKAADEKLLQMAKVFGISRTKKIIAIYIPSVIPYFVNKIYVAIGLCWKAGIAAEVIGIPTGSIGERLYEAKLYLMTKELFAWTIVIIMMSIIFEKAVILLLRLLHKDTGVIGKINE
jgi:NitT/TauT family transport system permease protein